MSTRHEDPTFVLTSRAILMQWTVTIITECSAGVPPLEASSRGQTINEAPGKCISFGLGIHIHSVRSNKHPTDVASLQCPLGQEHDQRSELAVPLVLSKFAVTVTTHVKQ